MGKPESEWGKLNAGQSYGILAVDVDRALAYAKLSEYEQILMQEIRELSWGTSTRRKARGRPWPDAVPAVIDLKAFAAELGIPWQRLYEVRARLVKSRMVSLEGGALTINKAADEWVKLDPRTGQVMVAPDGNPVPRLTPKLIARAAAARTRKKAATPPPDFTDQDGDEFTVNRERNSRSTVNEDSRSTVNGIHGQPLTAFTVNRERNSRLTVNRPIEDRARNSDPTGLDSQKTPPVCRDAGDTHTGDEIASTPQRSAEDYAAVRAAALVLAGDVRTQHLAGRLLAESNTPGLVALEGWRWPLAVNRLLAPGVDDGKRRSFPYLVSIARNLAEADREAGATDGRPAAPPSRAAEKARRQAEDLRAAAADLMEGR